MGSSAEFSTRPISSYFRRNAPRTWPQPLGDVLISILIIADESPSKTTLRERGNEAILANRDHRCCGVSARGLRSVAVRRKRVQHNAASGGHDSRRRHYNNGKASDTRSLRKNRIPDLSNGPSCE